ncbi:MAG TPA: hypothetical protein EYH02_00680 [Ignisphaera aggregans]|uniref:THUMP domain-containing protein n=1 Tax=Ignisphaera aggregans TaxID=334771 RepID=A0A832YX36_9CREN|nr:hypothetical protein [Ignisphaera aggregans]
MIEVKGSEPRLLITTVFGREAMAALEVESALLDMCRDVVVEYRRRKGLVIVFSSVCRDPYSMVLRLRARGCSAIRWAIPLQSYVRSRYEDIRRACRDIVMFYPERKPIILVGICRKRGWYIDSCTRLLKFVGEDLESLGIAEVDFKRYSYVLRIEIVDDVAFLSLYRRSDEHLFRFRPSYLHTQLPQVIV